MSAASTRRAESAPLGRRDPVSAHIALGLGRRQSEPHLLFHRAGQKAADAVLLPLRRLHHVLDAGAFRPVQQLQELRMFGDGAIDGVLDWGRLALVGPGRVCGGSKR